MLGILELLRFRKRVLHIDIDVRHRDDVEEASCTTEQAIDDLAYKGVFDRLLRQ